MGSAHHVRFVGALRVVSALLNSLLHCLAYGMQHATYYVQHAPHNMQTQHAKHYVQHAPRTTQDNTQNSPSSLQHSTCTTQLATCTTQLATCTMQHAPRSVQRAPRSVQHAPRNLQHATCKMHHAACNMHPAGNRHYSARCCITCCSSLRRSSMPRVTCLSASNGNIAPQHIRSAMWQAWRGRAHRAVGAVLRARQKSHRACDDFACEYDAAQAAQGGIDHGRRALM
jgi:hypothetical protein